MVTSCVSKISSAVAVKTWTSSTCVAASVSAWTSSVCSAVASARPTSFGGGAAGAPTAAGALKLP